MSLMPFPQRPRHVHDLPIEVRVEVFDLHEDDFLIQENTARQGPPPSVITLSHVCHRWRAVAIACQRLWSKALPCRSLDWTVLCLERCPTAPFELAVSGLDLAASEDYRSAYELVLRLLARANAVAFELDIGEPIPGPDDEFPSNALRHLFERLSTTQMPQARKLEVYRRTEFGALEDIATLDLTETMPALTELWFTGVIYRSPGGRSPFPQGLRKLYLCESRCWWTVDEMIESLQTMPMLEDFTYYMEPSTYKTGIVHAVSRLHQRRCIQLKKLRQFTCDRGSFVQSMLLFRRRSKVRTHEIPA